MPAGPGAPAAAPAFPEPSSLPDDEPPPLDEDDILAPDLAYGRPEDQPRIVRIEFEGTALFAGESLEVLMQLKEGERLDPVELDEDLETLYRFFENVRVTTERAPGGVILRFLVEENPLVVELNVYGTEEFGDQEIRGMMSTQVGYPLFPYALASDAEDIVEAYRMKGFYFAQVPEPVITTLEGGGRRVDFTIVEGPQVEVQRILFRGNAHVTRKDLLEVMDTEELGAIAFLSDAVFRLDTLLEDLIAIKRRVEAEGFLDAEVVLDDLRFSDDKERVFITILIVEHQAYTVGNVEVEIERLDPGEPGAPLPQDLSFFTEDNLRRMLGFRTGCRYSGRVEEEGRKRITEAYFCRSYIDAFVPPVQKRGRERSNVVDLKLIVSEGAKSRLRRLDFRGNEYTRDKILRREAHLSPGGYVDRRELDRAVSRLRALGYFERVTMELRDVKGPDGEVRGGVKDAVYEVVEGSTGKLNFGIGISTDGGVLGSISYSKRNFDITRWPRSFKELTTRRAFTGAGQTFDAMFAPGTIESQFAVSFGEPRLFGTNLAFNIQGYKRLQFWRDWSADRFGYQASLGYPIFRDIEDRYRLNTRLRWRHEEVYVGDLDVASIPGAYLFQGSNEVRSLELSLDFRTVDDLAMPTRTTRTRLSGEIAGAFLGGDTDFWKAQLQHDQSWVVFTDQDGKRHKLSVRGDVAYADALEDTPEVPPFERYYAGGNRLRGFRFRGVGPHINGNPTGGEWRVLASLEYLFPIVKDTVGVVAFVDSGTVATTIDGPDAGLWRVSVGGGLRIKVPMLGPTPLAFDLGWPLMYQPGDERTLVTFALGRDF